MGFNFSAAQKEALSDLKNNKLGVMILGQSGAGKSSLAGTFGVKTLYLYTTGESHGAKSAAGLGGEKVFPVCLDYSEGVALTPDQTYQRIVDVLTDVDGIKKQGFGAIVVDGATELETLIRGTSKWKTLCLTDKGKHNNFAEGTATLTMFRPVIDGLKNLQRDIGIHFAMTCILDVSALSDSGEILESRPRLSTYGVAEGLIAQFDDRIAVGRMCKGDKVAHRIQFLAGVSRDSKDIAGNIKKTINFSPRLAGKTLEQLPDTLAANLAELAKVKES